MRDDLLKERLQYLSRAGVQHLLQGRRIGLEKEGLRVSREGCISQRPHPIAFGSALTHPDITTDYSEALLELITPPMGDVDAVLQFLYKQHQFVYQHLDDELLWAASMPCVLNGDENIPIATYGRSNLGQFKRIYRRGLGWRYGRMMQIIAGIHFNFSLPDVFWHAFQEREGDTRPLQNFRSESYLGLIRNLQRVGWLVLYLFGASPAVCKSFLDKRTTPLPEFDAHSRYGPYATSLRMSHIGYTNRSNQQSGFTASENSLPEYLASLIQATHTPWPAYAQIGVQVDGDYRQLNTHILQIENEYYSTVRPKQPLRGHEKPANALQQRGVQYVELRSIDIDPHEPLGVTATQLRFLEVLMLFCLLYESPPLDAQAQQAIADNQMAVALSGRDPALRLRQCDQQMVPLRTWANQIMDALPPLCAWLDDNDDNAPYAAAVADQRVLIAYPECTPSARILAEMRAHGENFFTYARRLSEQHRATFMATPLSAEHMAQFTRTAAQSLQDQDALERADTQSFADFLQNYFAS